MTSLIQTEGAILKTDERGRVQTPAERRESLLDEFERSGLSAAKFAVLAGTEFQTFAAWWPRRRRQRGTSAAPTLSTDSARWLETMLTAPPRRDGIPPRGVLVRRIRVANPV